jgi:DNA-binding transcriptional LysR family regulator
VLDAVLVAGDQATADPPIVGVLALVVEQRRARIEALDHLLQHRAVVAEPDRPGKHQDVRAEHLLIQLRPRVADPAVLGHVWPDTRRDVMINRPDQFDPLYLVSDQPHQRLEDHRGSAWVGGCDRCRAATITACERAGFSPRIAYSCDDTVVAQSLVAAGMGVAILSGTTCPTLAHAESRRLRSGQQAARSTHAGGSAPSPVCARACTSFRLPSVVNPSAEGPSSADSS